MKRYRDSKLVWMGSIVAFLGAAPLLVTLIAAFLGLTEDPNPNPVGFGVLFFLTFWPGAAVAGLGVYLVNRYNRTHSGQTRSGQSHFGNQPDSD